MILSRKPQKDKAVDSAVVKEDEKSVALKLVIRARDGDDDAFSELVSMYEMYVYNIACHELSSSGFRIDDAEDVAQTAFMKAWRNLSSFRGDCAFSSWIYRITVNTAQDVIRSQLRKPVTSLTTEDDETGEEISIDVPVTEGDEVPEDSLERKETVRAVREAVESLSKEQREIIIMRDFNDLPYNVIADSLGIEIGTVKSRLNRARAALKEKLKDYL